MDFELAPEEKELLRQMTAAMAANDWETASRLGKALPIDPETAMAAKQTFGARFLLDGGYNLSWADKRYGDGWLAKKPANIATLPFSI